MWSQYLNKGLYAIRSFSACISGQFLNELIALIPIVKESPSHSQSRHLPPAVGGAGPVVISDPVRSKIRTAQPLRQHSSAVIRPPTPAPEINTLMPLGSLFPITFTAIFAYECLPTKYVLRNALPPCFKSRALVFQAVSTQVISSTMAKDIEPGSRSSRITSYVCVGLV